MQSTARLTIECFASFKYTRMLAGLLMLQSFQLSQPPLAHQNESNRGSRLLPPLVKNNLTWAVGLQDDHADHP
jgi:hypothetical protein